MAYIPLTQNKVAIVDDDLLEELSKHKWHFNRGYAWTWIGRKLVPMHRIVAGTPDGMITDHINGDKSDNRKSNLRICTPSQNECNKGLGKRNKSGYKGVCFEKQTNKWKAAIKKDGRWITLGRFNTPLEAAIARDNAAILCYSQFARLNLGGAQHSI